MSNKNLHKQIEDQQKVIQFLAEKYKQDTGCEIALPQTWSTFLGVEEEKAPIYDYPQQGEPYEMQKKPEFESFLQALSALNLPQKKPEGKKGASSSSTSTKDSKPGSKKQITTNFNPSNPFHMIEKIDLSNFAGKKFTRASMREFVESIADMRCLHTVILRNNGIDDTYTDELDALVNNWKIQSLDLSHNNIGKTGALALSKALKDNGGHIEWIDLSRNNFSDDYSAIGSICLGLKSQKNLHHFGLTVNTSDPKRTDFSLSEAPTKLLITMPSLRSIALVDSKVNNTAVQTIYNALTHQAHHITGLSFKFCFLDTRSVYLLAKALAINRTLVKLDLSNNGLSPITGVYIVKNLKNNITLTDLNLSKNGLNDDFAEALAETLTHNEILWRVDISQNPIGELGGQALLKAIRESNDSLESLGDDFAANSASMGVLNVEEIRKLLKQNRVSKEIRSKLLYEGRNTKGEDPKNLTLSQLNYTNSQSFFDAEIEDYKLNKPILFTNELFPKKTKTRLWNI